MTGTTPNYGLTYPTSGDQVKAAISTIPQQLATDVENALLGFGGIAAPAAWVALSYASNWSNLGGGFVAGQYRKVGNYVLIRGVILRSSSASGTNALIATLPVGFRPLAENRWPGDTGGAHTSIALQSDGSLRVAASVAAGANVQVNSPPIFLD